MGLPANIQPLQRISAIFSQQSANGSEGLQAEMGWFDKSVVEL